MLKIVFWRHLRLFLLGTLLWLTASFVINGNSAKFVAQLNSAQVVTGELKDIEACLPKNKNIQERNLIAAVSLDNKIYYLVEDKQEMTLSYFEDFQQIIEDYSVISQDEIGCFVEISSELINTTSMTNYIPESVANQLALVLTQKRVDQAGGKEAYLQQNFGSVIEEAGSGPWLFYPEIAWAYKQLKMPLPEPHLIIKNVDEAPPVPPIDEDTESVPLYWE